MKIQNNTTNRNNIHFEKFYKVKVPNTQLAKLKDVHTKTDKDILILSSKKKKKGKSVLYFLTGKDYDTFLNLMRKIHFYMLRTNLEDYMPNKPQKVSLDKAMKLFD